MRLEVFSVILINSQLIFKWWFGRFRTNSLLASILYQSETIYSQLCINICLYQFYEPKWRLYSEIICIQCILNASKLIHYCTIEKKLAGN